MNSLVHTYKFQPSKFISFSNGSQFRSIIINGKGIIYRKRPFTMCYISGRVGANNVAQSAISSASGNWDHQQRCSYYIFINGHKSPVIIKHSLLSLIGIMVMSKRRALFRVLRSAYEWPLVPLHFPCARTKIIKRILLPLPFHQDHYQS